MSEVGSGWPELDDALDRWTSATAALPIEFRSELLLVLDGLVQGRLTLEWPTVDDERRALVERFPHPFARVYDQTMLHLSLSLGLRGPLVRMIPLGGVVLRRHLGGDDGEAPRRHAVDPDELAQLRALLTSVTSEEVPEPGVDW